MLDPVTGESVRRHRPTRIAHMWLALAATVALLAGAAPVAGDADATHAVAVIVHPENSATDPTLHELRDLFVLDRQFWPDGRRVALFLPPGTSSVKEVLLERVYGMTDAQLRRYWTAKLFQGAIPAIPSSLKSVEAIAAAVQQSRGGLAAIPAAEVPQGVRVLSVDGKRPGDAGYPLAASASP